MQGEVRLTLELVTPLFLHGADPRGAPELRAPSLRGALRFWYRAAVAEPDSTRLREREAAVFGTTDRASPVRVRLTRVGQWSAQGWESMERLAPGSRAQPSGLSYLGFAFRAEGRTQRGAAQGFPSGTLYLHLASRRVAGHEGCVREALSALWLLLALGGLGGRSRRGFGSLRVTQVDAPDGLLADLPTLVFQPADPEALAAHLAEGLRRVHQVIRPSASRSLLAPYSMLRGDMARVIVLGKTWQTWHAVLSDVGAALAGFRREVGPPGRRVGFGLPVQNVNEAGGNRRASPLLIKVAKLGDGGYAAVLALLEARLLPAPAPASDPRMQHVRDFVDHMKGQNNGLEVPVP